MDELRARTPLSTLIGKSVKVTKAGREYKACCPFHNEKTPSFTINDEKGFYHCFGCGAHGDAIRWMTEQRGLPFMDAVKELALAAGLDVPAPDPRAAKKAETARGLHDAMAAAQNWFVEQLGGIEGAEARAYLDKRGLSEATRKAFGIGFAPDSRGKLRGALKEFGDPMLVETGMLIQPEVDGGKARDPYDRFRGRLMIPIRDARGRVIAFGGRILGAGEPKYLNSPDTPLFDKGRTLYNIDKALPAARQAGRVIVVEGYMDVIALAQAGIHECVAPLGTALTEHQIERLWKMVDVPILCFDGDSAGIRAADRAALRALPMLRPGHSLSFVTLPQGQDPDDMVRGKGAKAFEACLKGAKPLVERLWQHEREAGSIDTPEARAGLQQRLNDQVATIADPLVRKEYGKAVQDRFFLEFGWGWRKSERNAVRGFIARSLEEVSPKLATISQRVERMTHRAILLGLSRLPQILYSHREQIVALHMPTATLTEWKNLLIRASFERPALEENLLDAILADSSLGPIERRNIQHDLGFSFFRPGADPTMAEQDLVEVIEILRFEQELTAQLARHESALYAQGDESWISSEDWDQRQALLAQKRQNDERVMALKANIEEQLLAA
nr:DNA primase [Sphingobium subterraneum]